MGPLKFYFKSCLFFKKQKKNPEKTKCSQKPAQWKLYLIWAVFDRRWKATLFDLVKKSLLLFEVLQHGI